MNPRRQLDEAANRAVSEREWESRAMVKRADSDGWWMLPAIC
jgi:hypothetical protein